MVRLVRDFSPDIIAINETLLKPTGNFKLSGFSVVRKDGPEGADGVAVFVRRKVKYNIVNIDRINIPDRIQIILIEFQEFCLIAMYNPPDLAIDPEHLNAFLI